MTVLRLQSRVRYPVRSLFFRPTTFKLLSRRTHTQESCKLEGEKRSAQRDSGGTEGSPNHPIPSNEAHPTLRDGKQSPIADFEGNLRENLPRDVKEHNEEVEHRYDRAYNHMGDEGGVKKAWKRQWTYNSLLLSFSDDILLGTVVRIHCTTLWSLGMSYRYIFVLRNWHLEHNLFYCFRW